METIASFTVNHLLLDPGVYVSRQDRDEVTGCVVTTFDLRLTKWSQRIVYFGPMGCRTGFYLVVFGQVSSEEILPLVRELFVFVRDFEGAIPGAAPEECGNYLDQNLPMAKWLAARYLERDLDNIDEAHLHYQG